jgi:exosome complex protein LRP1
VIAMPLPPELNEGLTSLGDIIPKLTDEVSKLIDASPDGTITSGVHEIPNPITKAKLHVTAAFVLQSTLLLHLKLNGVDTKSVLSKNHMDRLKSYFSKIKQAEDRSKRI